MKGTDRVLAPRNRSENGDSSFDSASRLRIKRRYGGPQKKGSNSTAKFTMVGGVIRSKDGYVLTGEHFSQLPGERIAVHLSDGCDTDEVALGTNPIAGIGVVMITTAAMSCR